MVPSRRIHQNWLPDMFNDFFDDDFMMHQRHTTAPAINVIENEKNYDVEVAAPGMTKEDFNVSLDNNGDLVINLEKKVNNEEKDGKHKGHYLRREFSYTKFQQTLLLPEDVDKENISAKVEHGVLNITIPKIAKVEDHNINRMIDIQ